MKLNRKQKMQGGRHLAAWIGLLLVLAAGLWAYTRPEMSLHWDTIASMCGF